MHGEYGPIDWAIKECVGRVRVFDCIKPAFMKHKSRTQAVAKAGFLNQSGKSKRLKLRNTITPWPRGRGLNVIGSSE